MQIKSLFKIQIGILFLLSGCIESDINYTFPYDERPITIGFLDSIWGVRAWTGKTAKIFEKDSNRVTGASISLFDRSNLIESLTRQSQDIFISSIGFSPNRNEEYRLKSRNDLYLSELASDFATLPITVPIISVKYRSLNNGVSGIDLFVEFNDPIDFNAYGIYIQRFKKDTALNEDYSLNPFFVPFNGGLTNDREFNGLNHSIQIENYALEYRYNNKNVLADSIKVTLFNLSKPMYDLFLSLNTPEPGVGDPFFDPTIISNHSKDGIIVFGSYSQASLGLRIN